MYHSKCLPLFAKRELLEHKEIKLTTERIVFQIKTSRGVGIHVEIVQRVRLSCQHSAHLDTLHDTQIQHRDNGHYHHHLGPFRGGWMVGY